MGDFYGFRYQPEIYLTNAIEAEEQLLQRRRTVDGSGRKVVSGAGGVLLRRTATAVGVDAALSAARTIDRHTAFEIATEECVIRLTHGLQVTSRCPLDGAVTPR